MDELFYEWKEKYSFTDVDYSVFEDKFIRVMDKLCLKIYGHCKLIEEDYKALFHEISNRFPTSIFEVLKYMDFPREPHIFAGECYVQSILELISYQVEVLHSKRWWGGGTK